MRKICVLGLGYIGLPTASILATHGFNVTGVDTNHQTVQIINNGGLPIKEPGLKTIVSAALNSGNLVATTGPEAADVFIIAVPTPVDNLKNVDTSYIQAAADSIISLLAPGNLVILESTSPPGTTSGFLVNTLEKSGLKAGKDFYVAYCPERVLPGRVLKELIRNNRIIGGINSISAETAEKIYKTFVEGEIILTDSTTAEMVKLMENTYRDVNIALANEIAMICEHLGVNAWEVIQMANRHPRVNIHSPGPGVGGHCLAVDPWFVVELFPDIANLMALSRNTNDKMPCYTAGLVIRHLEDVKQPKVTLLGVSYKANIDDTRESPVLTIVKCLEESGIEIKIYDPNVKDFEYELSSLTESFSGSDLVLIVTDHEEFKFLNPQEIGKLMRHRIVIDTRNCINHTLWEKSDFTVHLLGGGILQKKFVTKGPYRYQF